MCHSLAPGSELDPNRSMKVLVAGRAKGLLLRHSDFVAKHEMMQPLSSQVLEE